MIASASSRELLTTTSAPNCLAASNRLSARSMATMWLGLNSRAPMMAAQPDRTRADDRHDIARLHGAVEDAHLVAGRQDVGQHQDLLVGDAGRHLVGGRVGERDTHVLGLGAVDHVAEDPSPAPEALAVAALPAEAARTARGDARDEHPVADLDRLHSGADGLDRAHRLVTEDPPIGHRRNVTLEDVQIGAADGDGVDADDRVGVVHDAWAWGLLPSLLTGSVVHERLHGRPPGRRDVDDDLDRRRPGRGEGHFAQAPAP